MLIIFHVYFMGCWWCMA